MIGMLHHCLTNRITYDPARAFPRRQPPDRHRCHMVAPLIPEVD
jgi:hypothetical protein